MQEVLHSVDAHDQLDLVDLLGDVAHGLELLEPHQHRVLPDHLGGVGHVARRGRILTTEDDVRGRRLLGLDHLVEQSLHLARQDDVLDTDAVDTNAERLGARDDLRLEVLRQRVATLEQLVERGARDVLTRCELNGEVQRLLDVRDRVNGHGRIGRCVLRGKGQAQRDLVTRHELLALDLHLLHAGVEHLHGDPLRGVVPERVPTRLEDSHEPTLHVLETTLELPHLCLDDLRPRNHSAELIGELRCRTGDVERLDQNVRVDGPDRALVHVKDNVLEHGETPCDGWKKRWPAPGTASTPWLICWYADERLRGAPQYLRATRFESRARERGRHREMRGAGEHADVVEVEASQAMRGRGFPLPGNHRRRPAQVFCGLRDRWDVGMSMPNAFTVPPPSVRSSEGKESNLHVPVSCEHHLVAPGTLDRVLATLLRTDPSDDLAWSTEPAHQRRFGLSA